MKHNQLKIGSILSYLQIILSVIIGLLYTPIMIRILGQNEYGLYNTVSSTISMLTVLSLGFNSGYVRYYAIYKKEDKTDAINRLNGLFIVIFSVIGIVALFCGIYLTNHLELVFRDGLKAEEYEIARVLMLILTINLAVSFPMSVFQNIITAHERFVFLKALGILKTVLSPLLTLPLLLLGYRSIAMVSVTVIISLVTDICYLLYTVNILKARFVFSNFEKGLFKSILVYTFFIAINMIIDQINWNIDKILLGRFKGTASVAVYSVGYNLYAYYMMISTAVSYVFTPKIHRIYNTYKDDSVKMKQLFTDLFIRVGRVQYLILGLLASGVVIFGKKFIYFWVGEGYEDSYYVSMLLIIPASIALIQNIGIEIQRAENKHQFRSIVYLVMAIANFILSIILCQRYGAIGAAVGTSISLIVANGFIMNIYYNKQCGIDIPAFWKNIGGMTVGYIIPGIVGIIIMKCIVFSSVAALFAGILIYTLIFFFSVWMFSMNDFEKNMIGKPVMVILQRMTKKRENKND